MAGVTLNRLLLFVALSAPLVYVSRRSLLAPRSHGLPRWIAWEAILGLLCLNVGDWFRAPFSPRQIASWLLLVLSIVPVVEGVRLLRRVGRPDASRSEDAAMLGFERTTALVTSGIYRYIRHPMYSSLLLLAWGVFLKAPSWWGTALAALATAALIATALTEEREDVRFFGPAYRQYRKRTRMFIPYLF